MLKVRVMEIRKDQWPALVVGTVMVVVFAAYYIAIRNYEFMIHIGVVSCIGVLILLTNHRVKYSNGLLWGLIVWGFLHLGGGSLQFHGQRWYDVILIPISESYGILRYDQFTHMIGFCVATLAVWEILRPALKKEHHWVRIGIVVVMAGLGLGALNEIVEFIATLFLAENGVGGYLNTSLDLVSDLIGAVAAFCIIKYKER